MHFHYRPYPKAVFWLLFLMLFLTSDLFAQRRGGRGGPGGGPQNFGVAYQHFPDSDIREYMFSYFQGTSLIGFRTLCFAGGIRTGIADDSSNFRYRFTLGEGSIQRRWYYLGATLADFNRQGLAESLDRWAEIRPGIGRRMGRPRAYLHPAVFGILGAGNLETGRANYPFADSLTTQTYRGLQVGYGALMRLGMGLRGYIEAGYSERNVVDGEEPRLQTFTLSGEFLLWRREGMGLFATGGYLKERFTFGQIDGSRDNQQFRIGLNLAVAPRRRPRDNWDFD